MIEKKRRITRSAFPHNNKQRMVLHGEFLTMTHYTDLSTPYSHFTVVVSKKTEKSAVGRNSLKRAVYHAVQQKESQFDTVYRGYLVFSFKKTQQKATFIDIQKDIEYFLNKKRQWKKP